MTDLHTENARLRAALRTCAEIAKWTPKHPACERVIDEVDAALAEVARLSTPPDDAEEVMLADLVEAIRPQISEGIGAILRKFCDSPEATKARTALHAMPDSDWNCLIDMLAQASAEAAHAARRKE